MTLYFKVRPANAQHKGNRDSQQDAFGFSLLSDTEFAKHGGVLAVIADGMGGMENGVWASTQATRLFIEAYLNKSPAENISTALLRSMRMANAVVYQEAMRLDLMENMGTTLVAAVVKEGELHWVNSGDSRVYLYEAGIMTCLSTDHNYFNQNLAPMIAAGKISLSEAQTNPKRDLLTSNLGRPEPIEVGYAKTPLRVSKGAWILLCTDGLTDTLSEAEIASHLQGDPQLACDKLIASVLEKSIRTQDNTTVVILHLAAEEQERRAVADQNLLSKQTSPGRRLSSSNVNRMAIALAMLCVVAAATLYWHQPAQSPNVLSASSDINSAAVAILESAESENPAPPVSSVIALPEAPALSSKSATAKSVKPTDSKKTRNSADSGIQANTANKSLASAPPTQTEDHADIKNTGQTPPENDKDKMNVNPSDALKAAKDKDAEIIVRKLEESKDVKSGGGKNKAPLKEGKTSEIGTEKKSGNAVNSVSKSEKKNE